MGRQALEVADVVRAHGGAYAAARGGRIPTSERRVLADVVRCRTAALGGHVERCSRCDHEAVAYNSCRNRHCPKCQAGCRAAWFADRERDVLPVQYFHVVFTVPREVAAIALQNKAAVYQILFRSAATTLVRLAADPKYLGAEIGVLAVLHTWGQTLDHHPHVHCVVPGGGIAPDQSKWIDCRPKFLFPVRVLGRLFRGIFLDALKSAFAQGRLEFHGSLVDLQDADALKRYLRPVYEKNWVVYSKPPFGGPAQVLKYLARYTHRVAIANSRLLRMKDGKVSFSWKDYAGGERRRVMTLDATEFLRRFLIHVLPSGFVRIRNYGFLANRHRTKKLALCRRLLGDVDSLLENDTDSARGDETDDDAQRRCPKCTEGTLVLVSFEPKGQKPVPAKPSPWDTS